MSRSLQLLLVVATACNRFYLADGIVVAPDFAKPTTDASGRFRVGLSDGWAAGAATLRVSQSGFVPYVTHFNAGDSTTRAMVVILRPDSL